jgi:REP-associated tyrosine transposase
MARQPRSALPAFGVFHVTSRGVDRCSIFYDDADRERFVVLLKKIVAEYCWQCHAYCLMGNHFHLLIEIELWSVSAGMHKLNGVYAQKFNERHKRIGHLFQERFHARVIRDDEHLADACAYIWNNPVRAGLCAEAHVWPWSGRLRAAQARR